MSKSATLSIMSSKGMSEGDMDDAMDISDKESSIHDGTDPLRHTKSMSDGVADDITVLKEPRSRKPGGNPYTQQRLPMWLPILTTSVAIWTFVVLGIFLLMLGGIFYATAESIVYVNLDYTYCKPNSASLAAGVTQTTCADYVAATPDGGLCACDVNFTAPSGFNNEELYMYYYLDNYYQNARRYVASVDYRQLHGDGEGTSTPCDDLQKNADGQEIAPCGFIANSFFNDTFTLFDNTDTNVSLSDDNIAWHSDVSFKYRNPVDGFNNTVTPPYWGGKTIDTVLGSAGFTNQDFVVWMRTAGLPWFHKFYRKIPGGLLAGQQYYVTVQYNYPTAVFSGNKKILITTMSWMGAQNHFLGIIYLAAGSVSVVIGLLFIFRQLCVPRRFGDARYLKWNHRPTTKEVKIPL
eukprot:CFRG6443T1